jgi:hypothetical protein
MKKNTMILCIQLFLMVVGFGCPILAIIIATKSEQYAMACTIGIITPFLLYLFEQFKK